MKIDFSKLAKKKAGSLPDTLEELFGQLDRKATHESLRPAQIEALTGLTEQLGQQDVILKLGTGSGKTVVGLVYAEYLRRKYAGEPVVYLCPTHQLIDQVAQTASVLGIPAEIFPPSGMPLNALDGQSVLICTYDKVFNGKSVFESRQLRPAAFVLDDVHAGIDRVNACFSLTLEGEIYQDVKALFAESCNKVDPALWRGVENSEHDARYEIPFWILQPRALALGNILNEHKDHDDLKFNIGNVSSYLELSRVCISGIAVEITYSIPPIEDIRSFAEAKHRLFMSASIKDGAALIRGLACNVSALNRVIEPASDKGAGERMVIPVSQVEYSLRKEPVAELCKSLVARTNVVVLCTAKAQAAAWVATGATLVQGKDVETAVTRLRSSSRGNYYVFAQRFDGVDLPDDACRILVLDGTPSGERIADTIDAARQRGSPGYSARVVNKFEQALGRAVRSSADYAAVLLVGTDIAGFLGRKDVKALLEPHTSEQIDLGKDLAKELSESGNALEAIKNAITAVLDRDEGWKEMHRERMAVVPRHTRVSGVLTQNETIADLERGAWQAAKARNYQAAVHKLHEVSDSKDVHSIQRAEILYKIAGFMNFFDGAKALAIHRSAYELVNLLPRPVDLPDRRYARASEQVGNLRNQFGEFATPNAAIARLEELKGELAFAGAPELVERALQSLGQFLGADSTRPEKETGRGPDNLWLFPDMAFCIEAKNKKERPIFKSDAEQLLIAQQWCTGQLSATKQPIVCVFATSNNTADRVEDLAFGPLFVDEKILLDIIDALRGVISSLSFDGPLFLDTAKLGKLLAESNLTPAGIKNRLIGMQST